MRSYFKSAVDRYCELAEMVQGHPIKLKYAATTFLQKTRTHLRNNVLVMMVYLLHALGASTSLPPLRRVLGAQRQYYSHVVLSLAMVVPMLARPSTALAGTLLAFAGFSNYDVVCDTSASFGAAICCVCAIKIKNSAADKVTRLNTRKARAVLRILR